MQILKNKGINLFITHKLWDTLLNFMIIINANPLIY